MRIFEFDTIKVLKTLFAQNYFHLILENSDIKKFKNWYAHRDLLSYFSNLRASNVTESIVYLKNYQAYKTNLYDVESSF